MWIFFQASDHGTYAKMYNEILKDPKNFVSRTSEGLEKVHTEKYAYITDETGLRMNASDNCNLVVIGERFYPSGFGLAFPEKWPYKKYFDYK